MSFVPAQRESAAAAVDNSARIGLAVTAPRARKAAPVLGANYAASKQFSAMTSARASAVREQTMAGSAWPATAEPLQALAAP